MKFVGQSNSNRPRTMKLLNISDLASEQEMPLPLRNGETYVRRECIDKLLNTFWNGKAAWLRQESEDDKIFTYGEATTMGVRQLIQLLELKGLDEEDRHKCDTPIIFYDLGSGAGKLVAQVFLENVVHCSIGVELSAHRHSLAEQNWSNLQKSPEAASGEFHQMFTTNHFMGQPKVQFLNQDILDTDFSDATHLYISSLCFPDEVTDKVCDVVMNNHRQFGRLRMVVALSNLPLFEAEENRSRWKKSFELIHMTWGFSTARLYKFVG